MEKSWTFGTGTETCVDSTRAYESRGGQATICRAELEECERREVKLTIGWRPVDVCWSDGHCNAPDGELRKCSPGEAELLKNKLSSPPLELELELELPLKPISSPHPSSLQPAPSNQSPKKPKKGMADTRAHIEAPNALNGDLCTTKARRRARPLTGLPLTNVRESAGHLCPMNELVR